MLGFVIAAFATALIALGITAYVVLQVFRNAAAFHGSAARFADAIENRAQKLAFPPSMVATSNEPSMPRIGVPEMPEILKTRWKERTAGSNLPDSWPMPPEEV